MLSRLEFFNHIRPSSVEAINDVYELPRIETAILYLQDDAGFPIKSTFLKIIQKGNYLTWTLINVKNVNKKFPESEETQKVHLRNQYQGLRSTKKPNSTTDLNSAYIIELPIIEKRKYIYTITYNTRETIFSDQTGKFPHTRWLSMR